MIHPSIIQEIVEAVDNRLADKMEDSAKYWREVAWQHLDTDLQLAIFAHRMAQDNEAAAKSERTSLSHAANH